MVGLNHEFARELLWREYPTDQRGSCFRQFWDVSSFFAGADAGDDACASACATSRRCTSGRATSKLGDHDARERPGDDEEEVVLVIRGELLKRYPNAVDLRAGGRMGALTERRDRSARRSARSSTLTPAEEDDPPRDEAAHAALQGEGRARHLLLRLRPDGAGGARAATGDAARRSGRLVLRASRSGRASRASASTRRSDAQIVVWNDLGWDRVPRSGEFIRPVGGNPRRPIPDSVAAGRGGEGAAARRGRAGALGRRRERRRARLRPVPGAGDGRRPRRRDAAPGAEAAGMADFDSHALRARRRPRAERATRARGSRRRTRRAARLAASTRGRHPHRRGGQAGGAGRARAGGGGRAARRRCSAASALAEPGGRRVRAGRRSARRDRQLERGDAAPPAARASRDALQDGHRRGRGARRALGAHLSRRLLGRHVRGRAVGDRGGERAPLLDRRRGRRAASRPSGAPPGATSSRATAPAAPRGSSSSTRRQARRAGEGRPRRRPARDRHRRSRRRAAEQAALRRLLEARVARRRRATRPATRRSRSRRRSAPPRRADADALIATFTPANLAAAPAPPPTQRRRRRRRRSWLALPAAADSKTRSWTAPARVDVLPDRFVVARLPGRHASCSRRGRADPVAARRRARPVRAAGRAARSTTRTASSSCPTSALDGRLRARGRGRHGLKVPLDPRASTSRGPIERVIALGLRLADDATQGAARARGAADAPPLRPRRLRARAAGHADQQHRRATAPDYRATTTRTRPTTRCSAPARAHAGSATGGSAQTASGSPTRSASTRDVFDGVPQRGGTRPRGGARDEPRALARDARLLRWRRCCTRCSTRRRSTRRAGSSRTS